MLTFAKYALFGVAFLFTSEASFAANLTANEIKTEVIGKKWKWNKGKYYGTIRFNKSGSINVTTNTNIKKDRGTWKIKGNKMCTSYNKIRGGKERCDTYSKKGKKILASDGGVLSR
ncbi:hypothetical protein [Hoeflea sp. TYP-13]|uniref:hypothetical protein n=1 Tax=Hoeflea sp. TYP-13 TaxID=3230023 RepID=UPI0034C65F4C